VAVCPGNPKNPVPQTTTHPATFPPLFPNRTPLISICCSHLQVATKCFIAFCCVILPSCTHRQGGGGYGVVHCENVAPLEIKKEFEIQKKIRMVRPKSNNLKNNFF